MIIKYSMIRNAEGQAATKRSDLSAALSAVIFDYGEVLCHRPTAEQFSRMARICGINADSFGAHWERSRGPYDRGDLTPEDYWSKFAHDTHTELDPEQIRQLCNWEIEMWSNVNSVMVEWLLELDTAGIKTGLLSNMPADLAAHLQQNFEWMSKFTCRTFSAHVRLIKPDPAIYRHILRGLDVEPSAALFVDDRENNIQAARALGMSAIRFQSIAQLRSELETLGFPILPKNGE